MEGGRILDAILNHDTRVKMAKCFNRMICFIETMIGYYCSVIYNNRIKFGSCFGNKHTLFHKIEDHLRTSNENSIHHADDVSHFRSFK